MGQASLTLTCDETAESMSFSDALGLHLALCQWDGDLPATLPAQVGVNSFCNGSVCRDVQMYVTYSQAKLA